MKKLQFAAFTVEFLTLLVWGCHRFMVPLPDWTVRLNGVIMMMSILVLAFASVRLAQDNRKER